MKATAHVSLVIAASFFLLVSPASGQLFGSSTFTRDMDADGVPETLTFSGTTAQIVSKSYGTRKFTIPARSSWQFGELDGRRGDDILLSNMMVINGAPQPASAAVIANKAAKTYSVGRSNYVQLHELDGQPGAEAIFTNLLLIQGMPQAATALVINSRTRTLARYAVGRMGRLDFADLDGEPGDEMIFTNLRSINTIYQPAQATIVDVRAGVMKTFKVGNAYGYTFAERNGKPGREVVFNSRTGSVVISFDAATHTFVAR